MAKITRAQIDGMNSKMANGFEFDLHYYLKHNEKQAHKFIELKNGKLLEVSLAWCKEFTTKKTSYGQKIKVLTGNSIIEAWFTEWSKRENGVLVSYGMSPHFPISTAKSRKMFSDIQKLSKEMTAEKLHSLYDFEEI